MKLLSLKADKEQVTQLVDNKANKQDMEMQLKAVEILQQQLSLVIILLIESVRGSQKTVGETESAIEKKRIILLENLTKVWFWAQEFDPWNINFHEAKIPPQLKRIITTASAHQDK